jgi:hypothetical protein
MAPTVKTNPNHPSSMAERVAKRLEPSAGAGAGDEQVTKGSGPTRTTTTVWHGGTARRQGNPAVGSNKQFKPDGNDR